MTAACARYRHDDPGNHVDPSITAHQAASAASANWLAYIPW